MLSYDNSINRFFDNKCVSIHHKHLQKHQMSVYLLEIYEAWKGRLIIGMLNISALHLFIAVLWKFISPLNQNKSLWIHYYSLIFFFYFHCLSDVCNEGVYRLSKDSFVVSDLFYIRYASCWLFDIFFYSFPYSSMSSYRNRIVLYISAIEL